MNVLSDEKIIAGNVTIALGDQLLATFWNAPWLYRIGGLCFVVALVSELASLWNSGFNTDSLEPLFVLGVVIAIVPACVALGFRRLITEQRTVTYEIGADRLVTRDATGAELAVPWMVIRRCRETRRGFAFKLKPAGLRWFPKRAFSPGAILALRVLVKSKLGEAAQIAGG